MSFKFHKVNGIKTAAAIVVIMLLQSCFFLPAEKPTSDEDVKKVNSEITGEYCFKYPSGEVEVVRMNSDSTYSQSVYKNDRDYRTMEKPIINNQGKWVNYENFVIFKNWQEYCYMSRFPDSILTEHDHRELSNVFWHCAEGRQNAILEINAETDYVLKKVK